MMPEQRLGLTPMAMPARATQPSSSQSYGQPAADHQPAGPVPAEAAGPVAEVESALVGIDGLDDLPVAEHVGRFDAVHAALTGALSTIDKV